MKIAFLIYELNAGGQERQMVYALEQLIQYKYRPTLFIWDNNISTTQDYMLSKNKIDIIPLKGNILCKIFHMRSVIKIKKIEILHTWSLLLNFIVNLTTIFINCKSFGSLRSVVYGHHLKGIRSFLKIKLILNLLFPSTIIANNHKGANELSKFRNAFCFSKSNNIPILHNRCIIPEINTHKYNSNSIKTISVGSLLPVKKIDFIIDVLFGLKKIYPNIKHYHAGANGSLISDLNQKIKQKNLEDCFYLLGELKDLNKLYMKSDLLVHASKYEGAPNVVLEAMSYGLPIVASDCGDISKYVFDKRNGMVFNHYNKSLWIENISSLLCDESLMHKMSLESRNIAINH